MITLESIREGAINITALEESVLFYEMLGMTFKEVAANRYALLAGTQKIDLNIVVPEIGQAEKKNADVWLLAQTPMDGIIKELKKYNVFIEKGPVERVTTSGTLYSVYVRDPDNNLIEVSTAAA